MKKNKQQWGSMCASVLLMVSPVITAATPVYAVTNNSSYQTSTRANEGVHAQPNIPWSDSWQTYNGMPTTHGDGGSWGAEHRLTGTHMSFTNSEEAGDTIPVIQLQGIQMEFPYSGVNNDVLGVSDLSLVNETQHKHIGVTEDQVEIYNQPKPSRLVIPLTDEDVKQNEDLVFGITINFKDRYGGNDTPPHSFLFRKAETMLTRVYYMDAATGEVLPGTSHEDLGKGMKVGDSVSASARDFTSEEYEYSGAYTIATPTSSTDGSGNTATTTLQQGDWDNTDTTTGRQAIIFWYNKQDKTAVNVHDSTIYAGADWKAEDNFDGAIASDGTALTYSEFINQGGVVDTSALNKDVPGTYPVTYTLNNVTSTANITVIENKQSINGSDVTKYVGDPMPDDTEFKASATDKDGNSIDVTVDKSQVNMSQPGDYDVVLTATDGQTKTVQVHVLENKAAVNVHDSTIYGGMNGEVTPWSPEDNFDNAVTSSGAEMTYKEFIEHGGVVDDSNFDKYNPGVYQVDYKLNGITSTATITVLKNQLDIRGDNVTKYVGDPLPGDSEFNPVGIDADGSSLDVQVDKSKVDMNTPGKYPVTLTMESKLFPVFDFYTTVYVTVKERQTAVNVHDSTIYVGDKWTAEDNFDSALDKDGNPVDFTDIQVDDSQVDPSKAGVYEVTYTYDGVTSTATVTVKDKQTAVNVHDSTIYVGDKWTAEDNFDSALDKDGNPVDFADIEVDDSQVDPTKVGVYEVTYTYDGVTSTATVTVKDKQTAVNVHDSTIYVGDKWTAEDNFDSALDKDGNPVDFTDIQVDDSQVDPTKVGVYEVTYTYDGVTSTVTVTVKDKQTAVNVHDSTIYVGDKWTAKDNFDSAIDKDGNPVDFADIQVDDSKVDPSKAGVYEVTYTYDGVTSTATVTVKDKQTAVNVHDSTIYVGDKWKAEDNFDSALDKDGNPVDFADIQVDDSKVDPSKAGVYEVTYTYDGVTSTATVTVKDKQTAVNVHDSTIYVGDKWTAEDNFDSALDKDGNPVDFADIEVDDSKVDPSKAGVYEVTYTYEGVTSTATVTVKDKQTAVNVHDSTIYVGDKWTAKDNFDSAIDKDGNPVDFADIQVDDSQADTSKAGQFNVTYAYDGMTSTATVTVKNKEIPKENSTVVVQYVDEDGNKISQDTVLTGKEGEKYHTKAKDIKGYELVKTPKNKDGEFKKEKIIVSYTYRETEVEETAVDHSTKSSEIRKKADKIVIASHNNNQRNFPKTNEQKDSIITILLGTIIVVFISVIFYRKKKD